MITKIAIVEDEEKAYLSLKEKIEKYSREKNHEFEIHYFFDGISFLNESDFDFQIVFMDINMPFMNGFDVAKKLREISSDAFLFFVTDLAQYAIKGYEVDATDYIVKPIIYDHLAFRLDKILDLLERKNDESKIALKTEEGRLIINASAIRFIETMDHKLTFHTTRGDYHAFGSLNDMEKILPKEDFIRCNHCYLINLRYVSEINKNDVALGNDKLAISRAKKKPFLDAFTDYLGRNN